MLEVQKSLIGYEPCCPLTLFDLTGTTTWKPWKQMTTKKMKTVASKLQTLGRFCRKKASRRARTLSFLVNKKWNKAITTPSNSGPRPLLIVVGLKAFHIIFSLHEQQSKLIKDQIKSQNHIKGQLVTKFHNNSSGLLPDIGSHEKGDPRAKTISLLEEFIDA